MKDFKNRVAVITGGASGVGFALGKALAKRNAKVILADIEEAALSLAVEELTQQNLTASVKVTDVSNFHSVKDLANFAKELHGKVHLLFNNAGIAPQEASFNIWDLSLNDWEWGFKVNIWGVIHGIKAFLPSMIDHGEEARIINTTSGNGALVTYPSTPIYATTKAAVTRITEALYFQLQSLNSSVKASILFPGPHTVETALFSSARNRPDDLPQEKEPSFKIETIEAMQEMVSAMGKELKTTLPEEVAEFCLEGIKKDKYWLLPVNQDSESAYKDYVESVITKSNPLPPEIL